VFAASCALNRRIRPQRVRRVLRVERALIIPAPGSRPIFAYAHSVFATFCALNVPPPPAPQAHSYIHTYIHTYIYQNIAVTARLFPHG
jgi:hypothetical protein